MLCFVCVTFHLFLNFFKLCFILIQSYTLADRGFVVFAACNMQEGRKQFLSKKKQIFAVKCDVTIEEDINNAGSVTTIAKVTPELPIG